MKTKEMKFVNKINAFTDAELLDPAFFSKVLEVLETRKMTIEATQLGIGGTNLKIVKF